MPALEEKKGTESKASAPVGVDSPTEQDYAKYWSPEHERLGLVCKDNQTIQFEDFVVRVINGGKAHKALESHSAKHVTFYKVLNSPGDDQYQVRFLGFLRRMVEADDQGADDVKTERGYRAVMALFERDELAGYGISMSKRDENVLIQAALKTKQVEGI